MDPTGHRLEGCCKVQTCLEPAGGGWEEEKEEEGERGEGEEVEEEWEEKVQKEWEKRGGVSEGEGGGKWLSQDIQRTEDQKVQCLWR